MSFKGPYWNKHYLKIFINGIDNKIECTISKFSNYTTVSAIQKDVDRPENWAHMKVMKFNKAKCKVLHLSQGNPQYQHRLGD